MTVIHVSINGKSLQKQLKRIEKGLNSKVAAESVFNTARLAKLLAKQLVPKDTGKTKKGIISIVKIRSKEEAEARVGFKSNPHPDKRYGGGEFNLPAWMTFSAKAPGHPWKSGNPRFLLIAAEEAEKELEQRVITNTGNLINA
ncbi:hypothetical protein DRN98_03985 [Methanosarcinales archaeon]|nr:MAG: hypothetical protein DRN98_03985 [Methanosarcinales archaeon]